MGGRRKSSKIPKKEKMQTIRTIFDCARCGFKNCVIVKIKKVIKKAELNCDKCNASFATNIKGLDEAIDVYHAWLNDLKKKNLTKGRLQNNFQENSSGEEGSQRNVEEILKQKDDDKKSQFSSDSLDMGEDEQKKVNRLSSDDEDLNDDNDELSDLSEIDVNDSLVSDVDDEQDLIDKVKKKLKQK